MARLPDRTCPRCLHSNPGLLRRCEECRALLEVLIELVPCPNCTKGNPKGAANCVECNFSLIDPPVPTRPCPNCTKQNPLSLSHCAECNYELLAPVSQPRTEAVAEMPDTSVSDQALPASDVLHEVPQSRKPSWLLGVVAGGFCLALLSWGVYSRQRMPEPPSAVRSAELRAPYWNSIVGLAVASQGSRPSRWLATGVFVASDGYLVTSSASIGDHRTLMLLQTDGSALGTAQRVELPTERGLAVFRACLPHPSVAADFLVRDGLADLPEISLAYLSATGVPALQPATLEPPSAALAASGYVVRSAPTLSLQSAVALTAQRAVLGIVSRIEQGKPLLLPASEILRSLTPLRELDTIHCASL